MKRGSRGEAREIANHESIVSIFGIAQERNYDNLKDDPTYKEFNRKIREIQDVATNMDFPVVEALQMILYNFGFWWDTIPYGRMNEMKEFVRNNGETRYKIIYPEMHAFLLTTGYYKMGKQKPSKELMSSFCGKIGKMMQEKRPREDFLNLGRAVQNYD